MADQSQILRPQPRRPFDLTPLSSEPSTPVTPSPENTNPELLDKNSNGGTTPSRTRSLLNLTSSTLLGIYSPTGYDISRDEPLTPWGTGSQTPSFRTGADETKCQSLAATEAKTNLTAPRPQHRNSVDFILSSTLRAVFLFLFGVAGGMIITHLHESDTVVPVKVEGIDKHSWFYITFWGVSGVVLGNLLPWIDSKADETRMGVEITRTSDRGNALKRVREEAARHSGPTASVGPDWNPAVRGIGAFVGIAFAIRRLQWQSTMQASLTLGLANPFLWYMVDRTKTGFALSIAVGILGTIVLLTVNPRMVPPPTTSRARSAFATELSQTLGSTDVITDEGIGVATWIASVLFCSSVCFGNIGRRLAKDTRSKIA